MASSQRTPFLRLCLTIKEAALYLKYLYYFSSPKMDLVEIKRLDLSEGSALSDIYKWMIIHKDLQKVTELHFESMERSGIEEIRTFIEAKLKFNEQEAHLNINEETLFLVKKEYEMISENSKQLVIAHLTIKQTN